MYCRADSRNHRETAPSAAPACPATTAEAHTVGPWLSHRRAVCPAGAKETKRDRVSVIARSRSRSRTVSLTPSMAAQNTPTKARPTSDHSSASARSSSAPVLPPPPWHHHAPSSAGSTDAEAASDGRARSLCSASAAASALVSSRSAQSRAAHTGASGGGAGGGGPATSSLSKNSPATSSLRNPNILLMAGCTAASNAHRSKLNLLSTAVTSKGWREDKKEKEYIWRARARKHARTNTRTHAPEYLSMLRVRGA